MGRPRNPNKKVKAMVVEKIDMEKKAVTVSHQMVPESELQENLLVSDEKVAGTPDPASVVECPVVQESGSKDLFERVNEHQVMMEEQATVILQGDKEMVESLSKKFEEAGLVEVPMPKLDLDEIRTMFPAPKCKIQHAYGLMKVCQLLEELATQLYFSCPHNIHLRQALCELQLVHEACNKAVQSE